MYTRDMWMNKYTLVSGDDVAITYWLYRNGWRTGFVSQDEYAIIAQQVPGTFRIHLGQVLRWARNRIRRILRDVGNIVSGSSPLWYRLLRLRSIVFPVMEEDYLLIPDFLTALLVPVAQAAGVLPSTTTVIPSSSTILFNYFGFNAMLEVGSSLWHFYRCPQSLWQLPALAFWGHIRMAVTIYAFLTLNQSGWMTRVGCLVSAITLCYVFIIIHPFVFYSRRTK